MINREFSQSTILKLQQLIREEQKCEHGQAAVEAEYLLYRTEERVLNGVRQRIGERLTDSFEVDGIKLKDLSLQYGVDLLGGLCILNAVLTTSKDYPAFHPLAEKLISTGKYTNALANALAALIVSGLDEKAALGITLYLEDKLDEDFCINGLSIRDAQSEFNCDLIIGLCILNISIDNEDYFQMPIWFIPIDKIDMEGIESEIGVE